MLFLVNIRFIYLLEFRIKKMSYKRPKKLLNFNSHFKMLKSRKHGFLNAILHLAPYNLSGYNVCPKASKGCSQACLNLSGMGVFKVNQLARINKTKFFFENRDLFLNQLDHEINLLKNKAKLLGFKLAIRLNGTSDLPFEVDLAAGIEVVSERLFQADTDIITRKAGRLQALDRRAEQPRCGRQKDGEAAGNVADLGSERVEPLDRGGIERLILDAFQEARNRGFVRAVVGQEFVERLRCEIAIARVVVIGPRGAGDGQPVGEQAVGMQAVKRGDQHPLCQIAGRAKQQQFSGGFAHLSRS